MNMSARKLDIQRIARSINRCVYLGVFSATAKTYMFISLMKLSLIIALNTFQKFLPILTQFLFANPFDIQHFIKCSGLDAAHIP